MSRLAEQSRNRWIALAVIVAAQFMVVLDVAIVNVALPSIKTDLGFTEASLQWVITAYAIMFGGVLLLGGRMADLLGRRRLFIAGLVLFTTASLLSGLAWSEGSLIVFRALQGLGGGLLSPAALSILTTTFAEGRERNMALGVWGAVSGSGGALQNLRRRGSEILDHHVRPTGRVGPARQGQDRRHEDQSDRRAHLPHRLPSA